MDKEEEIAEEIEKLKENLEEACNAALRLQQLNVLGRNEYENEFNCAIARMESIVDEKLVEKTYSVKVTYETAITTLKSQGDIENAIWVGSHEIRKFENQEEIRADASHIEVCRYE